MDEYKGIAASPGVAIGPLWVYRPTAIQIPTHTIRDTDAEVAQLPAAFAIARAQLEALFQKTQEEIGAEEAAIFEAHMMFLDDSTLRDAIHSKIETEGLNAAAAVHAAGEEVAGEFLALDDEYFRARAADVRDVAGRLTRVLLGVSTEGLQMPSTPVIVVADDLTPSDTVQFDRERLLGLVTVRGGPTSHTAILARTLGVPSAVSVPLPLETIENGQPVVVDGFTGKVIVNPADSFLEEAQAQLDQWKARLTGELLLAKEAAVTLDGHRAEIVANVGNVGDARQAMTSGAEGIGLFRTEFLFLDRDSMPTEEEQYKAYLQVFEVIGESKPIVVRTLDIGGDKSVSYLGFAEEQNPFLGWRAVRMIDRHSDLLEMQFRALLRAGAGYDLRIMVPMISVRSELERVRVLYDDAKRTLTRDGIPFCETAQFGVMIEVPSAALIVEHLAPLVDFFSIGTNDLTQYTLAVDRTNERVAALASPYHPAVLRLIERTIREAHKQGKWVGVCGELAGEASAVPLLLGMGLDEFSMSPASIPTVKAAIRRSTLRDCRSIAARALELPSKAEVLQYLQTVAV